MLGLQMTRSPKLSRRIKEYHAARLWSSAVYLIDRFIRDRLLMEAALDHPRTREQWRRYRFIVEQARAFAGTGVSSLRGFPGVDESAGGRGRKTD